MANAHFPLALDGAKGDLKHRGASDEINTVENDIIKRRHELYELQRQYKRLIASVNRYSVYKDFLEKVEEKSGSGGAVGGLIDRFDKLTQTYQNINKQMDDLNRTKDQFTRDHAEQVNVCIFCSLILNAA